MQNVKKSIVILLLLASFAGRAQDSEVIRNYINTYKEIAIAEMQRTGVPASIKLAQGIHETMAGTSDLVVKSNNHFGIKCKATWTGESVRHDDDLRQECFRKYVSAQDSYRDHSDFLKNSPRYAFLFQLDPMNYESWAYGLKKAGYATNPKYPQIIIKLIKDYNLQDYTLIALGKMPLENPVTLVNATEKKEAEIIAVPAVIKTEEPVRIEEKPARTVVIQKEIYPVVEFKRNETRVIYVKKRTSFLAIATQYNVPLARLFEFNDMRETEMIDNDQLIYLQRKRKTGLNELHIIQQGETIYDIAQTEAIRLESLLEYNFLQAGMKPAIGEQLYLHAKAPHAPRLALPEDNTLIPPPGNLVTCTVQPGETIYSIAKKFNAKIDDIVEWNKLDGYTVKAGQQLKIYK